MYRHLLIYISLLAGTLLVPWIGSSLSPKIAHGSAATRDFQQASETKRAIAPLPTPEALDPQKISLGERLFKEPRLSGDDSVSCHDCHNLTTGGVDRRPQSTGVGGDLTPLNTPTVFNVRYNYRLLWNGRFEDLESQLDTLVQHSSILRTSWSQILAKLKLDPSYPAAFGKIYPEGMTASSLSNALVVYQQSLVTPNSPFDKYLRGEKAALSPKARDGYDKFLSYGCVSCHQGVNLGGNVFQTFGVMKDYYADRRETQSLPVEYLGRYNVTGKEEDKYVFRVASLRNVALTPPYFHDASAATLEEAVRIMAEYQLGRRLSAGDVEAIVAFLKALTGEYQGRDLAAVDGT